MNISFGQPPLPKPPPPTLADKAGRMLDRFFGIFSPTTELARMQARVSSERARLAYNAAHSGRERAPAPALQAPNSPGNQVDANAMLRRSTDQQRNNSFVNTLVGSIVDFTIGRGATWIPTLKDPTKEMAYREFLNRWYKNADARGNHHFTDLIRMALSGVVYQGTHGFIHHHNPDLSFQISSVRGQNIGNPQTNRLDPNIVQGVVVGAGGNILAFDIYKQTIYNQWEFVDRVPDLIFSYLNPVESDDDLKNVTLLKTILNDTHDMSRLEAALMKKIQWHAAKNAVINPPNGRPPTPRGGDPNDFLSDSSGGGVGVQSRLLEVQWGETIYGEPGMGIEVVRNDTPTDQEMEFLEYKLQQIAGALQLPLPFVYMMVGASVPGTLTRAMSKRAQRTFQEGRIGQEWLKRTCLEELITKALMSGIIRGEIPWDEDWFRGEFMFTAHPTTDVGNESDAMLNENRQGVTSRKEICGAKGMYYGDVDAQIRREAKSKIIDAIQVAKEIQKETDVKMDWQQVMPHLQLMTPNGNEISATMDKEEKAGASDKSGDNTKKLAPAKNDA
jgi:capsid protein